MTRAHPMSGSLLRIPGATWGCVAVRDAIVSSIRAVAADSGEAYS